jgi:glycine cleavage system aminomethyltransferase T
MTRDPYAFISPSAVAPAGGHRPLLRSPIEHAHVAAGASIEEQDGWRVAAYEGERGDAWLADLSHLGKLDLRGSQAELDDLTGRLPAGGAREAGDAWLARITPTHGHLALGGPAWREVWMRSSGVDAREASFPAGRCLAASVMRVPTLAINQGKQVLMLVGWEFGEYFWESILDAGLTLGITPVSAGAPARAEATV